MRPTARHLSGLPEMRQGMREYKHIIDDFPEVVEVMNDEVHHGDAVMGLL